MWKNILEEKYTFVQHDVPISRVISSLKKERLVLVFKGKAYFGVVTKKNLLRIGLNMPESKVSTVSIKAPVISKDMSDNEVAEYFVHSGLPKLPVCHKDKVLGVVDRTKFLKQIASKLIGNVLVSAVATTDVVTIKPDENLAKALALFKEYSITKLVVYDDKVQGVITLTNILNHFSKQGKLNIANLRSTNVKSVMKEEVYGVKQSDTLQRAMDEFAKHNTSSLVVFGESLIFKKRRNLFGIITKSDILTRYVAQFKKTKVKSTISSKILGLDRSLVETKLHSLERILDKGTEVFVYLKKGKEKFRGLPLISCRLRIISPGRAENISVEGWGVEHSLELAISKIKRRLRDASYF